MQELPDWPALQSLLFNTPASTTTTHIAAENFNFWRSLEDHVDASTWRRLWQKKKYITKQQCKPPPPNAFDAQEPFPLRPCP